MTITPEKRASYDPIALKEAETWVGSGGISECIRYELNGKVWVEKKLLGHRTGESQHIPWIKNEAEILAALNGHDQFPRFFGSYVPTNAWHPELLTLMMEYIDGDSLDKYRRDKKIAVSVGHDVCTGLKIMGEKGIVHRDLKPDNILVTKKDLRCKIIDFGLARYKDNELAPPDAVFGTLEFMSPEQARGEPVDPKTDVFSLAMGLYETLTGKLAFVPHYLDRYLAARGWNLEGIENAKMELVNEGMSESFANAWGLAVHPVATERKLEPLRSELEQLVRR